MNKREDLIVKKSLNEQGAVLVLALVMLVILSIMGAFALTISSVEQRVTLNSEIFQHNFYAAEAVTLEGAAQIGQTNDDDLLPGGTPPTWMVADPGAANGYALTLRQSDQWATGAPLLTPQQTVLNIDPVNILPAGYAQDGTTAGDRIWYAAVDNGFCFGASITQPDFEERCFDVLGMYDVKRGAGKTYSGRLMVSVGYKKIVYK